MPCNNYDEPKIAEDAQGHRTADGQPHANNEDSEARALKSS